MIPQRKRLSSRDRLVDHLDSLGFRVRKDFMIMPATGGKTLITRRCDSPRSVRLVLPVDLDAISYSLWAYDTIEARDYSPGFGTYELIKRGSLYGIEDWYRQQGRRPDLFPLERTAAYEAELKAVPLRMRPQTPTAWIVGPKIPVGGHLMDRDRAEIMALRRLLANPTIESVDLFEVRPPTYADFRNVPFLAEVLGTLRTHFAIGENGPQPDGPDGPDSRVDNGSRRLDFDVTYRGPESVALEEAVWDFIRASSDLDGIPWIRTGVSHTITRSVVQGESE